jgi:hypothetical protein
VAGRRLLELTGDVEEEPGALSDSYLTGVRGAPPYQPHVDRLLGADRTPLHMTFDANDHHTQEGP